MMHVSAGALKCSDIVRVEIGPPGRRGCPRSYTVGAIPPPQRSVGHRAQVNEGSVASRQDRGWNGVARGFSRTSSRENRGWPGPEGLIIPGCHYKSVESFWTIPHGWSLTNLQGDRERLKVVLKDVSVLAVPGSTCITQSLGCRGGSNRTETPPANSMSYV